MDQPLNLDEAFERFDEHWEPRVVCRVNDYDVRIAKVAGDHAWHAHDDTDEFFLCLAGRLTIELRDRTVVLDPGDVFTVPRGAEHFPRAAEGTRILMLEPRGTATTGDRHDDIAHLRTTHGLDLDQ
ncbi:cupin domain-containing protein [Aquipuribacter nitratireducens]|uniref:Cupin domain-containing protein n=1 Tax=Aquipuribacter nitratireducens TaxID=650104 RepID=A0ABW0GQ72_9MICO